MGSHQINYCELICIIIVHIDINECNNSPRPCAEVCTNINGSYICSCNDSTHFVTADGDCTGNII